MSKKLKIALSIIILIALLGIVMFFVRRIDTAYTIIKNGYSSYKSKIISNYQEYQEFVNYINKENESYGKVYNFNSNKYNKNYFNNNSLAIINIVTGNRSNTLKNIDISITGDTLVCKANIEYGGGITDDINGKLILVEIDKSVIDFRIERNIRNE